MGFIRAGDKTMTYTVIANDPGLRNDPWGVVGVEWDNKTDKIEIKLAKQFKGTNLNVISDFIYRVHNDIKPDMHTIEINGIGKDIYTRIIRSTHNFKWLRPMSTSGEMTESARRRGYAMDKPFMVGWLRDQKKIGNLVFPKNPQEDMQELERQMTEFVPITTPNGSTSYKRMRGRHDDLFMALLMACNIVRIRKEHLRFN